MRFLKTTKKMLLIGGAMMMASANAAELELTHWWGEAPEAITKMGNHLNKKTGHTIKNTLIPAKSAPSLTTSRILGNNPMQIAAIKHSDALELVKAGKMRNLADVYRSQNWKKSVGTTNFGPCTYKGKVYCTPLNLRSINWLYISHKPFKELGIPVPKNFDELVKAAPKLRANGIVPLGVGNQSWQIRIVADAVFGGYFTKKQIIRLFKDKDVSVLDTSNGKKALQGLANARKMAKGSNAQQWTDVVKNVAAGKNASQIMGDWAQKFFMLKKKFVPGKDFSCLTGIGRGGALQTTSDAFYYPKQKSSKYAKAQKQFVELVYSDEMQVALNVGKNTIPIRKGVKFTHGNVCLNKTAVKASKDNTVTIPSDLIADNTINTDRTSLLMEFWGSDMSTSEFKKEFKKILSQ